MVGRPWPGLVALLGCAVVAQAVPLRVATLNVANGIGAPGTAPFLAVKEIVRRLDPDVMVFVETDSASNFADLKALLTELGRATDRAHLATGDDAFPSGPYVGGQFYFSTQCLAIASRHPIVKTSQIGRSDTGRREFTRFPLAVDIDVPGTADDPTVVAVHYKQGSTEADRFRKAVESWRTTQYLTQQGRSGAAHNVIVLGDFNEQPDLPQPASFTTTGVGAGYTFPDGSSLPDNPGTADDYRLGPDVPATLTYATFPAAAFSAVGLSPLVTFQADGTSDRTYWPTGDARLDYVLVSSHISANGRTFSETYNARLEHAFDGLPKAPELPDKAADISHTASDHFAVFANLQLDARPSMYVTFAPATVVEGAATQGTVTLTQPAASATTVALSQYRPGGVTSLPASVTFAAGETTKSFSLASVANPAPSPDRTVTITASASGFTTGHGSFILKNREASGEVILSQYVDPSTGTAPKVIEIARPLGPTLDFSITPLIVRKYVNGSTAFDVEARVESGTLPQGAVVVIGDESAGNYLVAQGLLAAPAAAFSTYASGTPFTAPDGRLIYVKDPFTFNGDDALELYLDYQRADVFGSIGQDPGSAWSGSGVSTADQNIQLKPTAGTGTAGFTNPSLRFVSAGSANSLTGFGAAPDFASTDPYLAWAAALGLTASTAAPTADGRGAGTANLLQFSVAGVTPNAVPALPGLTVRHRLAAGDVTLSVEASNDLLTWIAGPAAPASVVDHGDGTRSATYQDATGHRFFRVRAVKP